MQPEKPDKSRPCQPASDPQVLWRSKQLHFTPQAEHPPVAGERAAWSIQSPDCTPWQPPSPFSGALLCEAGDRQDDNREPGSVAF